MSNVHTQIHLKKPDTSARAQVRPGDLREVLADPSHAGGARRMWHAEGRFRRAGPGPGRPRELRPGPIGRRLGLMGPELSDAALVARCRAGDDSAWALLVERFSR